MRTDPPIASPEINSWPQNACRLPSWHLQNVSFLKECAVLQLVMTKVGGCNSPETSSQKELLDGLQLHDRPGCGISIVCIKVRARGKTHERKTHVSLK